MTVDPPLQSYNHQNIHPNGVKSMMLVIIIMMLHNLEEILHILTIKTLKNY